MRSVMNDARRSRMLAAVVASAMALVAWEVLHPGVAVVVVVAVVTAGAVAAGAGGDQAVRLAGVCQFPALVAELHQPVPVPSFVTIGTVAVVALTALVSGGLPRIGSAGSER